MAFNLNRSGLSRAETGESFDAKLGNLYRRHGHPMPDVETVNRLRAIGEEPTLERAETLCELIEHARSRNGVRLAGDVFGEALSYGLKNFRGIELFPRHICDLSLREVDLAGAGLQGISFVSVDFSEANLADADLTGTTFYQSNLNTANIPRITINGKTVDLTEEAMTLGSNHTWEIHKTGIMQMDNCRVCEMTNSDILSRSPHTGTYMSRKAAVLFQDGMPLGYVKLKGEKTFLALRTVTAATGEAIFWKGMIYALEDEFRIWLLDKSLEFKDVNAWRRVDLEKAAKADYFGRKLGKLARNNLRFIHDSTLYPKMTELTRTLELNTEPEVDMLA